MTQGTLTWAACGARTGQGIRVAVIDTGIHAGHPHIGGGVDGVAIDHDGVVSGDVLDVVGHGTAVAAAIREKAPRIELLAVRVFDRRLATTGSALVHGLRWAISQRVHLINLSLGTTNDAHRQLLESCVADAGAHGTVVVAAGPQPDAAWLPGGLKGVIAVDADWSGDRDSCAWTIADGGVRLCASAYPRPIPGVPVERNVSGLSFAVANATGFLALLLEATDTGSAPADNADTTGVARVRRRLSAGVLQVVR